MKTVKIINGENKPIFVFENIYAEIVKASKDFRNSFAILTDVNGKYHTVDYDVNFPNRLV